MALLFSDGCDIYTAASDLTGKGYQGVNSVAINGSFGVSSNAGAYGGGAITVSLTNSGPCLSTYNVFTYTDGITLNYGLSFKQSTPPNARISGSSNCAGMLVFTIDSPSSADAYTVLSLDPSGKIVATQLASTVIVLGMGTHNVCDGLYHWIEAQFVLTSATTGTVKIYVDGNLDLSLTNVQTVATGQSVSGGFGFGTGSSNASVTVANWYDDIIMWDNTGTKFNTFPLGQRQITTLKSTAAGDSTQFTASAGANWSVAAQGFAGTATLTSTTAGQFDLYTINGMGAVSPATIDAVTLNVYGYNPGGAGTFQITPKIKSGGTVVNGTAITTAAALANYQRPFYVDGSGAAWTVAKINAAQIGMGD